jgi:hypothetical protein
VSAAGSVLAILSGAFPLCRLRLSLKSLRSPDCRERWVALSTLSTELARSHYTALEADGLEPVGRGVDTATSKGRARDVR